MPAAPEWTASLAAGSPTTCRRQVRLNVIVGYDDNARRSRSVRRSLPSSAVTTPFTRIGIEVMLCSHLTSCTSTNTALKITQDAMRRRQQKQAYLPAEGAVDLSSNVGRQPGVIGLQIPQTEHRPSSVSVGEKTWTEMQTSLTEVDTNLVHLAKVQALEVLERQVWRQNEPVSQNRVKTRGMKS